MRKRDELQTRITSSLLIVDKYGWLLNTRVVDFFVDDHWNKLPNSWRETLKNVDLPEIGDFLLGGQPKRVFPLSILALLVNVKNLSLSRIPTDNERPDNETTEKEYIFDASENSLHCKESSFNNLFLKRVKKKKRHEIALMSHLVNKTARDINCSGVVDIGSGMGHLVRTLAYRHKLTTIGIEYQHKLVDEARKLDDQFGTTLKKYTKQNEIIEELKPQHINKMLTLEIKSSVFKECHAIFKNNFGLVGLHPCGDLGPLLLRMFNDSDAIKFICIVGCCYMKLTCDDSNSAGYPMSAFVSNLKAKPLEWESRELACHALELYCQRLQKGLYEDLQIHCFRAVLEKLLVSKWPQLRHGAVKSVKHYEKLTFENYCDIATERLGVRFDVEDDLRTQNVTEDLKRWKEVVMFYTLRLSLAPLVESIILMDRMLYLRESGITCEIIPLFDPVVSPRNHILIARKC
ncbi:methyltransferase-like protein 25B [Arctopsyche grandis]|uniref:methyltransferase-like protein 25B n=1 Tax=Arctopsyche grandis TaxID=121162 RepID=UPI00406DA465